MITRDEAIETLYELIDNPIISSDLSETLQDIAICIDDEKAGFHTWGIPDKDQTTLNTAYREDLKEEIENAKKVAKKYAFGPSEWEKENSEEEEC